MAAIRQSPFGGMVPAIDDRLLPDVNGALSQNAWLYSGTAIGLPQYKELYTIIGGVVGKVYRIPDKYTDALHLLNSKWMEFNHPDTDVVRSQVIGDTYDRFYWVSPNTPPRYAPLSVILGDISGTNTGAVKRPDIPHAYLLGIPAPAALAYSVTNVGSSSTLKAVSYVHTWVSAYGEEGPPSPPLTISSVKIDATVTLTLAGADPADVAPSAAWPATPDVRNLTKSRIYRTIVGTDGTATFFFVAEVPITTAPATSTYIDNYNINSDAVIALNEQLKSTTWSAPPSDLQGWVSLSNGMVVGFRSNELWFCEPFRMHAWPVQYTLVTEYPIIGLGVANQTLVVLTEGFVYTATGVHPSSILLAKLPGLQPCTSRGSIVSTTIGVYFSAPQGLVLVSAAGIIVATKELIRKSEWSELVPTTTLRAAGLGPAYYAFGQLLPGVFEPTAFSLPNPSAPLPEDRIGAFTTEDQSMARRGVLIDPTSLTVAFNELSSVQPMVNVFNDAWSAEMFVIRGGKVLWLDIGDELQPRDSFVWRSKIFQFGTDHNFQAMKVYFNAKPKWVIPPIQYGTIPNMTGEVTSGVTMAADSFIVGSEPWRAGSTTPGDAWSSEITEMPHWLVVSLREPKLVTTYQMVGPPSTVSAPNASPRDWTLSGSSNGIVYTVVDTRTAEAPLASGELRRFTVTSPGSFKYYRMDITAAQGGYTGVTIGDFQLNESVLGIIRVYADDRKIMERALVRSGEQWRLPSGFRAEFWQWEVESAVEVYSAQLATTPKELQGV